MANNHYIVKRKGGGGGIEIICFQSSLRFQILDTKGFNSTNKTYKESRQINNAAPLTASKINVMKFVVKIAQRLAVFHSIQFSPLNILKLWNQFQTDRGVVLFVECAPFRFCKFR